MKITSRSHRSKPAWLKKSLPKGGDFQRVRNLLNRSQLHTVCQEANCPNMFECFSKDTATFMILGAHCTRNCGFCNVTHDTPLAVDPGEPHRIARAVQELNLKYVVITSVTRDDLLDGGASHFASVLSCLKSLEPRPRVEVLIPDFKGDIKALRKVVDAGPDVLNHNIETVEALYPVVRPQADFYQSLNLLKNVKQTAPSIMTKSGIMVGLGERFEQLEETFDQLFEHTCDILTIGQYLQPSRHHIKVQKYYTPEEFKDLKQMAVKAGIKKIAAGPFVRSSYQAADLFDS